MSQDRMVGPERADDLESLEPDELVPDDDGTEPTVDQIEELAAIAASETDALAEVQAALEAERAQARAVLERYRASALAAEPELPPDLVQGETLDELEASLAAARSAVAEVRARLGERPGGSDERGPQRGFPVGAPPRGEMTTSGLSAAEKIRLGLERRERG